MTGRRVITDEYTVYVRECFVPAHNLRLSCPAPDWIDVPLLRAFVFEVIDVEPAHRNRGVCRRLLAAACADPRFDLVVVEAVGNELLRRALTRYGWAHDPGVQDFYWRRAVPVD